MPDPVELRRYAHLLDQGLPPADQAAHFSWLYRLAATDRTLRLCGDVVAMQPQGWAALRIRGRMFGWCPSPGRLPFRGRELAHHDEMDAAALGRALRWALAVLVPSTPPTYSDGGPRATPEEVLAHWQDELNALRLLDESPVLVVRVERLASGGGFCVA